MSLHEAFAVGQWVLNAILVRFELLLVLRTRFSGLLSCKGLRSRQLHVASVTTTTLVLALLYERGKSMSQVRKLVTKKLEQWKGRKETSSIMVLMTTEACLAEISFLRKVSRIRRCSSCSRNLSLRTCSKRNHDPKIHKLIYWNEGVYVFFSFILAIRRHANNIKAPNHTFSAFKIAALVGLPMGTFWFNNFCRFSSSCCFFSRSASSSLWFTRNKID